MFYACSYAVSGVVNDDGNDDKMYTQKMYSVRCFWQSMACLFTDAHACTPPLLGIFQNNIPLYGY